MSGNQAIAINSNAVNGLGALGTDYAITTNGSDWYWAVTAIMMASTIAFLGLATTKPRTHRIFHYITASITMVASVAYFTMASNLGYVGIPAEFSYHGADQQVREIFYVRYIDWVVTTPLLLTDLLLTAGMPMPSIGFTILIDEIMIVTGLIGALVSTSYKWGYWTFGTVALFYIIYQLTFEARLHANHLGKDIGRVFLMTGSWTALLWMLYPLAWGLCEGSNYLHPDSEAIFYGILDVCAKPVFGALLLYGHRNIEPQRLGLHIRDYDEKDFSTNGRNSEKVAEPVHGTNGTTTTAPVVATV